MNKVLWTVATIICAAAAGAGAQPESGASEEQPDLLTQAYGATLVVEHSEQRGMKVPLDLINGDDADNGWSSRGPQQPPPYTFVFELLAPTVLEQVGVNTAGPRPGGAAGAAAKTVDIAVSADGPDAGYRDLGTVVVPEDGEGFIDVPTADPVQWVRFTVRGNHGNEMFTYLDEVKAFGTQALVPSDDGRFTGLFDTQLGVLSMTHEGTEISGCFEDGLIIGHVEGGIARLNWRRVQSPDVNGAAMFVINHAGDLSGVYYRGRSRSLWSGPPNPQLESPCGAPDPAANPVQQALEDAGEVILYGILFDYDSDTLQPESAPALERLHDAMEAMPAAAFDIEGHTDSDGSDTYNLDLSQRRAESVIVWLTERGIDPTRLNAVGKGETDPVASNETADGRRLNRRVEAKVHK